MDSRPPYAPIISRFAPKKNNKKVKLTPSIFRKQQNKCATKFNYTKPSPLFQYEY